MAFLINQDASIKLSGPDVQRLKYWGLLIKEHSDNALVNWTEADQELLSYLLENVRDFNRMKAMYGSKH